MFDSRNYTCILRNNERLKEVYIYLSILLCVRSALGVWFINKHNMMHLYCISCAFINCTQLHINSLPNDLAWRIKCKWYRRVQTSNEEWVIALLGGTVEQILFTAMHRNGRIWIRLINTETVPTYVIHLSRLTRYLELSKGLYAVYVWAVIYHLSSQFWRVLPLSNRKQ